MVVRLIPVGLRYNTIHLPKNSKEKYSLYGNAFLYRRNFFEIGFSG